MNSFTPFEPATPAMIVGRPMRDDMPVPLGLDQPFALLGGDRLGADGIPLRIMHDHQPAFQDWVAQTCAGLLAAERPWFRSGPLLLSGQEGAGRTHAARWLAKIAGVPHAIINLTDPVIAANIAASRRMSEALWGSSITIAMAAAQCANPVVTVLGVDRMSDDVAAGFMAMIDPETNSAWCEDQLKVRIDLGEVSWVLQCDDLGKVPPSLRKLASHVYLSAPPIGVDTTLALSIALEAMDDLGIDPTHPAMSWHAIRNRTSRSHRPRAKALYADMIGAITGLMRGETPTAKDEDGDDDDYLPF